MYKYHVIYCSTHMLFLLSLVWCAIELLSIPLNTNIFLVNDPLSLRVSKLMALVQIQPCIFFYQQYTGFLNSHEVVSTIQVY